MNEKNEKISGDLKVKFKIPEKLDNFLYHYKWHTIAAVFVLIVGVILTLQLCTKENYDIHILYAGEKNISSSSLSGDGSNEYSSLVAALEDIRNAGNDGDKVNINLQKLYVLSESELEEALSKLKDPFEKASLETSIAENYDSLYSLLMYGEYYLALLSEDIYLSYENKLDTSIFAPIKNYTKEGAEYEFAGEGGIYLSSLDIYSDPALNILPEDTVVCIRLPGVLGARDDGEAYKKAEDMLRAMLGNSK